MNSLNETPNIEKFRACMVLAAVGDAMGYKNGDWEFLTNSTILHENMMKITNGKGVLGLKIDLKWRYSDDTVMHIATALALIDRNCKEKNRKDQTIVAISQKFAIEYKKCWSRMSGRAPGKTTGKSISHLEASGENWDKIPYNDRAVGCGASMRSACIGLAYFDNIEKLVALSIEAGRITHHNPGAYLGSLVSSYFTALAVKGIDPNLWLAYFLEEAEPIAVQYIISAKREVELNLKSKNWKAFIDSLKSYSKQRNLSESIKVIKKAEFPEKYGIKERDTFYREISWGSWPGALGLDSVLIAYDALLSSEGKWEELCLRGILHGGDNDSTGTIAGAWFGAFYGFKGVPENHYKEVEDIKKLEYLGEELMKL